MFVGSLAHAVWAGGGTTLTALLGILGFGESAHFLRLAGLGFVIAGVVALNLSTR
ncbi:SMR family transporter [Acidovorax sp. 99]|uniref:SMR family transporter n=1 Tax=Acidovorax sp. 99 TaxID=2135634 RepID=UPI00325F9BA5